MLLPNAEHLDLTEAIAAYRRDGVGRIGMALSPQGADALAARADDFMQGRVKIDGMFFQHDSETGRYQDLSFAGDFVGPSQNYRKLEKLERDELFRAWIENPLFARIAAAVIPGPVTLLRAVLWTKSATGGMQLDWHQDGGAFWGLDRPPVLQLWTALDDAPVEAGCVEVLPGTHIAGLATPEGGQVPDAMVAARLAQGPALAMPAKRGEVLILHNHVWHHSGTNSTGLPRRAFSICYMDARTRCRRKRSAPRQFMRVFEATNR